MIETTVLYSTAAAVIAGLAVWVVFVLATAKEPWARPALAGDAPSPPEAAPPPGLDADATEKATPFAKGKTDEGEPKSEP